VLRSSNANDIATAAVSASRWKRADVADHRFLIMDLAGRYRWKPDIPSYLRRRCALARLAIDLPQRPPPAVNQD
jgi:hypothetical protein